MSEYLLKPTVVQARQEVKAKQIISLYVEDLNVKLTTISKKTGLPVSTVYDLLKRIKQEYEFRLVYRRKDTGEQDWNSNGYKVDFEHKSKKAKNPLKWKENGA